MSDLWICHNQSILIPESEGLHQGAGSGMGDLVRLHRSILMSSRLCANRKPTLSFVTPGSYIRIGEEMRKAKQLEVRTSDNKAVLVC